MANCQVVFQGSYCFVSQLKRLELVSSARGLFVLSALLPVRSPERSSIVGLFDAGASNLHT